MPPGRATTPGFWPTPPLYLKNLGQQAYFVNIPSKFISEDGRTMWLCYFANFAGGWADVDIQSRPEGSKYAMCLQEIKLLGR